MYRLRLAEKTFFAHETGRYRGELTKICLSCTDEMHLLNVAARHMSTPVDGHIYRHHLKDQYQTSPLSLSSSVVSDFTWRSCQVLYSGHRLRQLKRLAASHHPQVLYTSGEKREKNLEQVKYRREMSSKYM